MDDKKKKVIIISIVCVLVLLIGLIITWVIINKNSKNTKQLVEVSGETVGEIDRFIDVLRIEDSLKMQSQIITDDMGIDISEQQSEKLLEIGVPEEDISGFKIYSAQELLDINLIADEREVAKEIADENSDINNEQEQKSNAIYFHTEEEAQEIIKANESKEESQKYIDSEGRYVVTKSEEYIINKTTKVVFLVKPRDGKYAREILIEGIIPKNLEANTETEDATKEPDETNETETSKEPVEESKTEACLTKLSTLKYKVELKYPEESEEKEYLFDNGIEENASVEPVVQDETQQVIDTVEENTLSVGTADISIDNEEQDYAPYTNTFFIDENGVITTKYIDKDSKEHEENIIINFIQFSAPTCTSNEAQIILSNIDREEKKTAIYKIAKLDVDISTMTEEQIKEIEKNIKEYIPTLVYSEEIISNTIDYAALENGIYVVEFKITANSQKNILDSNSASISFHKTNGTVSEVQETEQEGNFKLKYVSVNEYTLTDSQLNTLMNRGKVTINIKSNISKVTISVEAEDPEATISGDGTMPVTPTTKSITITSKGQTKRVYIILNRQDETQGNNSNGGTSTSGNNNNGGSSSSNTPTHTHSYGAWTNNGDAGEIRKCSCGAIETREHKLTTTTKTPATCTQAEVTLDTCSNGCGYSKEKTGSKNASNHANYGENSKVTTTATCTVAGVTTYTCKGCGAVTRTVTGSKNTSNHSNYGENSKVTTTATCKVAGVTTYTCKGCGAVTRTVTGSKNASNHANYGTTQKTITAATCGASGVAGNYCKGCNALLSKVTLPATGNHTGGTHSNGGKCTTCGTVYQTHTWIYGAHTYRKCSCGKEEGSKNHTYGYGVNSFFTSSSTTSHPKSIGTWYRRCVGSTCYNRDATTTIHRVTNESGTTGAVKLKCSYCGWL